MKKFWTGFLVGLAGVLGIIVGTLIVFSKYRVIENEAKAKATLELGQKEEKVSAVQYQERVSEVMSELSTATIDEVTAKFLAKFNVGGQG